MDAKTIPIEIKLGLDPTLYKIREFRFSKSVGGAHISIWDPLPEWDDLVDARVSRSWSFDIECLGKSDPPETLSIILLGQPATIHCNGWCKNVGFYFTDYFSVEQVPYGMTNI